MPYKSKEVGGSKRGIPLLPAALSLLGCIVAAPAAAQPSASLEQELSAVGWSAERAADGSLILRPPAPEKESPAVSEPAPQTPKAETFTERLRARGWGVEEEPDGTLVLNPPQVPAAPRVGQGGAIGSEAPKSPSLAEDTESGASATHGLADALRERNWQVEELADGSLIIQPPTGEQTPESAVFDPGCGPWTAPAVTDGDIKLPVNTWAEAHLITRQWLDQQAPKGLLVGKIRKVLKVYLVSIVADQRPFELVHQLVIRSRDGRLLFVH